MLTETKGVFLELDRTRWVKFTWENENHSPGTIVEITIEQPDSEPVKMTLVHSRLADETQLKDMETGWSWALVSVKSYLETGRPIGFEEWQKGRSSSLDK